MDRIMQVGKSNKHVLNWNLNQIQLVQTRYKTSKWLTPFLKGKKEKKKKKKTLLLHRLPKEESYKESERKEKYCIYNYFYNIFYKS